MRQRLACITLTLAFGCAAATAASCSGDPADGSPGTGGSTTTSSNTGGGANTGGTHAGGSGPLDLCAGLVTDLDARPMTALAKPALGATVTDAEFGTTIRRITAVTAGAGDRVIKPMYTTISGWNADESRLILYSVADGQHELYDGRSYAFIEVLDIAPADLEQVYWHTSDPDVLFYVEGRDFVRYHLASHTKEVLTTFSFCTGTVSGGGDPMFTSWNSERIGLGCDDQVFLYDIASNAILARVTLAENPAQAAPSGTLAYRSDSGVVTDMLLVPQRTLDLLEPYAHASMSRLPNGHDTWNGAVYDPGPAGNDDIGTLVTWDLSDATSHVVIGPKTGFPYPPDGHLSGMAYRQPGWIFVSTIGDTSGQGLLDMENLIADTTTGTVCRIGRNRSHGKGNLQLAEPYWAEPHAVPSPSGTRAVFASDWGGGATVDSYVVELPSYVP